MTEQQLEIDNYLRAVLSNDVSGEGSRLLLSRFEEMQTEIAELREQLKSVSTPAFDKVPAFAAVTAIEDDDRDFRGGD